MKIDHEQKLSDAVKRVQAMDEIDGHEDRSIGTMIAALECGLSGPDNSAAYDVLVMLIDIRSTIKNIRRLNIVSIKLLFKMMDDRVFLIAEQTGNEPDPNNN